MQAVFQGRNDTEVAAAAAQPPQQLRVLLLTRVHERATCRDDIGPFEVVASKAKPAAEATEASAQGETGSPGVRDGASRGGEAERRTLAVELTKQRPRLQKRRLHGGVHAHAAHRGEVDHDSAVAAGFAGGTVTTRAHGGEQLMLARKVDGVHNVRGPDARCNERGALIDGPVPYPARLFVSSMCRQ